MDRLLEVGDQFRCAKFKDAVGRVLTKELYKENETPKLDFSDLSIDNCYTIQISFKETKENGWYRDQSVTIDRRAYHLNLDKEIFIVTRTELSGGTSKYSHDYYPDGHAVTATTLDNKHTIYFYQTGCFISKAEPEEIELVASGQGFIKPEKQKLYTLVLSKDEDNSKIIFEITSLLKNKNVTFKLYENE